MASSVPVPVLPLVRRVSLLLVAGVFALDCGHGSAGSAGSDGGPVDEKALAGERARLSEEMEQLVRRQLWQGVEKKYAALEALGVPLPLEDHVNGAQAARAQGDVRSAYDRLQRAVKIKATKDVTDWISDIDANYGPVELTSVPARSTDLVPEEMPFDPNQRLAVDTAVSQAKDDGAFVGLLPKGGYTFGGQPFRVDPGVIVKIELSPKARRQGIIDPVIRYPDGQGPPAGTAGGAGEEGGGP